MGNDTEILGQTCLLYTSPEESPQWDILTEAAPADNKKYR